MVYLIVTSCYPSSKAGEVGKIYMEMLKKYPPDRSLGKMVVPVGARPTKEGAEAISIMDVKEGKIADALTFCVNRMSMYGSIEGYEYDLNVWATQAEIMEMNQDLKLPE